MINEILDKIESVPYGRKIYNLEISMSRLFTAEKGKKLEKIAKYTGSFIVTEKGYLLGGHDDKLDNVHAAIYNSEKLPPTIMYGNGTTDKIIRDISGLRLAELNYRREKEKACCYRP